MAFAALRAKCERRSSSPMVSLARCNHFKPPKTKVPPYFSTVEPPTQGPCDVLVDICPSSLTALLDFICPELKTVSLSLQTKGRTPSASERRRSAPFHRTSHPAAPRGLKFHPRIPMHGRQGSLLWNACPHFPIPPFWMVRVRPEGRGVSFPRLGPGVKNAHPSVPSP